MQDNIQIGNRSFPLKRKTYIMGILNVTPDSFSDGGKHNQIDGALFHTENMIKEGADIIDVGGESTRPGYEMISIEEEMERILPIIEKIKQNFDIPVSVDTYKSKVAKAALLTGADLVNDIWGLKYDQEMAGVIKKYNGAVCIMHNRKKAEYTCFIKEALGDLEESITIANQAGIDKNKILIDPGVGFGKTYEMNLECMGSLSQYQSLGFPVLLGTSRKSVIGITLDLPVEEREEGTITTTVMAVMEGCQFVRVHNVKANKRAIQMTEAILYRHTSASFSK